MQERCTAAADVYSAAIALNEIRTKVVPFSNARTSVEQACLALCGVARYRPLACLCTIS
jgi:hypothetical protein